MSRIQNLKRLVEAKCPWLEHTNLALPEKLQKIAIQLFILNEGHTFEASEVRKALQEYAAFGLLKEEIAPARFCSVCGEPQTKTLGGWCCCNGHGGAPAKGELSD